MGNEYTVREVAYLPAPTRLCSEASHNSTGTDETVDCVHDLNTEPRRSHILRLNFTRVAPSWAVVDNGQRHTEAQYYRWGRLSALCLPTWIRRPRKPCALARQTKRGCEGMQASRRVEGTASMYASSNSCQCRAMPCNQRFSVE